MTIKTEFASVEENDGKIRKAIERRAYALYERDGSKDGSDQEHWFRAEKELTIQEVTCSIENDEVTVRLPMEGFSASTVLVSISARSAPCRGMPAFGQPFCAIVPEIVWDLPASDIES